MFALGSVQVTELDILCLGQLVSVDTHFFFRRSIPLYGKHWLHFSGRLPWPHVPQLHQPSPSTAECQQRAHHSPCDEGHEKGHIILGCRRQNRRDFAQNWLILLKKKAMLLLVRAVAWLMLWSCFVVRAVLRGRVLTMLRLATFLAK